MAGLFLERAWLLGGYLVVLQFLLIVIWSRWRTRLWTQAVWCGFVVLVGAPLLSLAVTTPRERIINLCQSLAQLIDDGDPLGMESLLSKDFRAGELDAVSFLEKVEVSLTRYRVDHPRLGRFQVAFPDSVNATVLFDVHCAVRSVDTYLDHVFSRWKLTFHRDAGTWRVTHLEAVPTPLSPVRRLGDWLN